MQRKEAGGGPGRGEKRKREGKERLSGKGEREGRKREGQGRHLLAVSTEASNVRRMLSGY